MTTKQCDSDKNHSSLNVNSKTYTREEIEEVRGFLFFRRDDGVCVKAADMLRQCLARIDQLERDAAMMDQTFKIRLDASMRAIKRWQAETGRDMMWPDHEDMVVWLLEKLEAEPSEAEVEAVQHAIHDELTRWDDGDPRSIYWRRAITKAAIAAFLNSRRIKDGN